MGIDTCMCAIGGEVRLGSAGTRMSLVKAPMLRWWRQEGGGGGGGFGGAAGPPEPPKPPLFLSPLPFTSFYHIFLSHLPITSSYHIFLLHLPITSSYYTFQAIALSH